MRLNPLPPLLPLALLLATCAPIGAQEPAAVSIRSPAELREEMPPPSVTVRLPCLPAAEAELRMREQGFVLAAAGVAEQVVVRLYLGGADAFALVGFDGLGRACLIAGGQGWTGIRPGAGLQALVPFAERIAEIAAQADAGPSDQAAAGEVMP